MLSIMVLLMRTKYVSLVLPLIIKGYRQKRKTNLVIASALSRIYGRLSKFSEKTHL